MDKKSELNNRGAEFISSGDFESAEKELEKALRLFPGDPLVCYNMGFVFLKSGRAGQAAAWFDRALENSGEVRLEKDELVSLAMDCGLACYEHSLYDDALRFYDYAASLGAGSAEYWNRRGVLCFVTEKYPEAQECFEKAVNLSPASMDAWYNLADTYEMTGNMEKAENARKRFLSLEKEAES